jgi:hypothetical protein
MAKIKKYKFPSKLFEQWILLDRLVDVVLDNVEGCLVEIGMGRSTYVLAHYAKEFGRKMYACDSHKGKSRKIEKDIGYENLIIYPGKSLHFMEEFNDDPAVVLLDGNHLYKTVSVEARFFLDKLLPGGVMFLHDTYIHPKYYQAYVDKGKAHRYDTYKIRQELEMAKNAWCLTFPYTAANCGLTIVLKKKPDEPFYRM